MSPLPLSSAGFNLWEWINAYGSGIGAMAGVAAALVAVFALLSAAFEYQVIDVTESDAALEYVKELGYLTAPVVVVSEHDHWGGFRPDQIDRVAAGGASDDETVGE